MYRKERISKRERIVNNRSGFIILFGRRGGSTAVVIVCVCVWVCVYFFLYIFLLSICAAVAAAYAGGIIKNKNKREGPAERVPSSVVIHSLGAQPQQSVSRGDLNARALHRRHSRMNRRTVETRVVLTGKHGIIKKKPRRPITCWCAERVCVYLKRWILILKSFKNSIAQTADGRTTKVDISFDTIFYFYYSCTSWYRKTFTIFYLNGTTVNFPTTMATAAAAAEFDANNNSAGVPLQEKILVQEKYSLRPRASLKREEPDEENEEGWKPSSRGRSTKRRQKPKPLSRCVSLLFILLFWVQFFLPFGYRPGYL